MKRRVRARFLLSCYLLLVLSACGNKGPLYLPEAEEEKVEKKKIENENQTGTE